MKIYHGQCSPNDIKQCYDAAPSFTHGYEWNPDYMTPHDAPYILDNGAFKAYRDGVPWDADAFVGRLGQLDTMPRDPDFVVLPDVVTNPDRTKERASKWAGVIDYPTAFCAQDGVEPQEAVEFAERIDAEVVFVGGTAEWKRRHADEFVDAAHDSGLKCHIGRPGDLVWANSIGADSVDTTTIVRSPAYHKLERLENSQGQATVADF